MKFTEAQLEKAFAELLENENFPHHLGETIARAADEVLIEQDLKRIFDYISPNTINNSAFSHRIYELLLRTCTEFENNARAILQSNGYSMKSNLKINRDYFKINQALKLDGYEVRLNIWDSSPLSIAPFSAWNTTTYQPLQWYQNYNSVKHNRSANFHLANLETLIQAISGLFIILYSQFECKAFNPYGSISMINDDRIFLSVSGGLFEIKPYLWSQTENYSFDWDTLKNSSNPFQSYSF